jgi:hypothetical protein
MGHEERFPPTRLSAGCAFRKETIAGMRRNGRDAPIPDSRSGPELSTKIRRMWLSAALTGRKDHRDLSGETINV